MTALPQAQTEGVPIQSALARYADFRRAQDFDPTWTKKVLGIVRKGAFACGWTDVRQIDADGVIEILNTMRSARRSPKYRNNTRGAWHSFCEFCVTRGWLHRNPVEAVPSVKVRATHPRRVPSWAEVVKLSKAVKDQPRKKDRWLAYLLAACTGIRHGEMRGLEERDLTFDGEVWLIRVRAEVAKNGHERTCIVPDFLTEVFAQRARDPDPNAPLLRGIPKPDKFDLDLKLANIPKANADGQTFSFHSFRHFFDQQIQSRQEELRADLRKRAEAMGHLDDRVTKSVYDDPSQDPMRETLRKIGPPTRPFFCRAKVKNTPKPVDTFARFADSIPAVMLSPAQVGAPRGIQGRRFESSHPDSAGGKNPGTDPERFTHSTSGLSSQSGSWTLSGPGVGVPCGGESTSPSRGVPASLDPDTISAIAEGIARGLTKAHHHEDPTRQAPGRNA